MLQRIHERISGWIAIVVIALVGGAFVLFGIQYYFQQGAGDRNLAATVNGEKITHQQVHLTYTQMLRQTMQEMGGRVLTPSMKSQIKSMALQSAITNTALVTTLEKSGFYIGLPQIKMLIAQAPEFQENHQFSQEKFETILAQTGLSPAALFDRVRTQFILNQATNGIAASAFMLPNELTHLFSLLNQQRAFGYMMIPANYFNKKITVTEKAVKKYYQDNKSAFLAPEKVKVSYITLSPTIIEKTVTIPASETKAYYDANIINYEVPARWALEQVVVAVPKKAAANVRAKEKKKAAVLAKNWRKGVSPEGVSQVTLSAAQISDQLRAALTSLAVGQVSSPIQTANGFTVLKLVKFTKKKTRAFSSVQASLEAMLKHQRVNQVLSKKSSQLADMTYTNPGSLVPAAKALGLTVKTSALITKQGEKTGLFSNQKVLSAVFSDDVLKNNNNSSPITIAGGAQVVVRVSKNVPSKQLSLTDVAKKIKATLEKKQAKAQAGLLAYQLQQQSSSGKNPTLLAKQKHLSWHVVALASQGDKSLAHVPQEILKSAFQTPVNAFHSIKKPIGVNTVLLSNGDYAVVVIKQVKNAKIDSVSVKTRAQLATRLSGLWGQLLEHFFVKNVVSTAKIKINQAA